jgi:hypothetical protein
MLQKALELNPKKERGRFVRGQVLLVQGRSQQALTEIKQEAGGIWKLAGKALAYHSLGRPQDSDAAFQQLIATSQRDSAYQIADVTHFGVNRKRRLSGSSVLTASGTAVSFP